MAWPYVSIVGADHLALRSNRDWTSAGNGRNPASRWRSGTRGGRPTQALLYRLPRAGPSPRSRTDRTGHLPPQPPTPKRTAVIDGPRRSPTRQWSRLPATGLP